MKTGPPLKRRAGLFMAAGKTRLIPLAQERKQY